MVEIEKKTTAMASLPSNEIWMWTNCRMKQRNRENNKETNNDKIDRACGKKRTRLKRPVCACDTNRINANWIVQICPLLFIWMWYELGRLVRSQCLLQFAFYRWIRWFPLSFVAIFTSFDLRRVFINFKNEKCAYKWKRIECPDSVFIEWKTKNYGNAFTLQFINARAHTHIHASTNIFWFDAVRWLVQQK